MKPTTHCPINRFVVCSHGVTSKIQKQEKLAGSNVCQWWCDVEEVCSVKLIAMELIKLKEDK